ncbi:MAG TPA: protein kinase, partial [Vicinamibacterales bacterium]|nr:protein kinase [Vicinamibacterales bacterium]
MTYQDPTAFTPPAAFGPFRVLHQIGTGVLGPVFRTYEPARDRLVAVKAFRLDITPEQSRRLADELQRLVDAALVHPSIVAPIAAGVEGTVAYLALEYVAAESLDVALRHYAPAPVEKVLPFIAQLAGAVDFARAAGFGHGALHPRDIFVTPDEARATGVGVAQALERVGVRPPVRRPYTAPERIAGEPWGTPADVFSLAAVASELLTGRRPAGPDAAPEIDPAVPHARAIAAVIARALALDPSARFATALAFASALEAAASGEGESAGRPLVAVPETPDVSPGGTAAPRGVAATATGAPADVATRES